MKKQTFFNTFLWAPVTVMFTLSHCGKPEEAQPVELSLMVEYRDINHTGDIMAISDSLVPPVIYTNPVSLNHLPVDTKKEKFIDMMLPSILYAHHNIEQMRNKVEGLYQKTLAGDTLAAGEADYLAEQMEAFKAGDIEELLEKLTTHPVSITLAQAALESGWGSSRFFLEGNNIFGIWSFNRAEKRIKAQADRNGRPIYVRSYDHISGSIEDYYKTLARVNAYKKFRKARVQTDNVYEMIPFLQRYSELGPTYVARLRSVIEQNNLTQYDNYRLDPAYFVPVPYDDALIASVN